MASVYLATDPVSGKPVAIKVLRTKVTQSKKGRERFLRETTALRELSHPHILKLLAWGESQSKQLYLVTEYIEGSDLGRLVRDTGALPEPVVFAIGFVLADALAYAHARGVIHRDLKPENVFASTERIVLGDFGMVKAFTADSAMGTADLNPRTDIVGAPGFTPPEVLKSEILDERTDVFSLGALLYYLATAQVPFEGRTVGELLAAFERAPRALSTLGVSKRLSRVVHWALSTDPKARPQSMLTVRELLQTAYPGLTIDTAELGARQHLRGEPVTALRLKRGWGSILDVFRRISR